MKFKNMKKGRVIEHKESGAIAMVLCELDDAAELLFRNPDLNPHDTGCATYTLNSWEAEEYRLINRPVVNVVYEVERGLVTACESVSDDDPRYFYGSDAIEYLFEGNNMPAIGFI